MSKRTIKVKNRRKKIDEMNRRKELNKETDEENRIKE